MAKSKFSWHSQNGKSVICQQSEDWQGSIAKLACINMQLYKIRSKISSYHYYYIKYVVKALQVIHPQIWMPARLTIL